MKIVIAPDSFKESLSAAAVAAAIESGLRIIWPDATILCVPMADGGEGTVAAVVAASSGSLCSAQVTGPMGQPICASYGLIDNGRIAILEMASASGLELVPTGERNPMLATSFGTGELLRHALSSGATRIVLGIGGSATVDGGLGMLQAVGAKLLDRSGKPIGRGGAALADVASIDLSTLDPRLAHCRIEVACDVDNPLTGPSGAAAVFGPQKGATPKMVAQLDHGLTNLADILARDLGQPIAAMPGAGAAGGLGATLVACLGATLRPGAELIADLVNLEQALRDADLVITGEGRVDAQTAHGKTPAGVAKLARRYGVPVLALAGSADADAQAVLNSGLDAVFPIVQSPCTREQAYAHTARNLETTARNLAALWTVATRTHIAR